ncbi:D-glycero-alpha-D-manno-heptose-1,7-bisphosphate 7-phosphatase [Henriciella aquimarina]|uniref:D-glycero-alpha-D-manno-heptose-1,7-bisphosphate 7-phosphatase n=1 Tax=Henriciella aquimarina TaxID=545261 RepID=UPI000A02A2A9|nr:HAD family hydrolase [Henriciella aquimarina]
MTTRRPALFLDRDGVLNVDRGYVSRVEDFEWIEGAIDCVANFKRRGWFVFVVTNQSGIARGLYTEEDMQTLHAHMAEELEKAGTAIDHFYYAPWHEAGEIARYRRESIDRKPGPGMLLQAMADFPVNREQSFLIGDKQTDMEAARAAGVGAFLFTGGNLATFAEWALASFEDGVRG